MEPDAAELLVPPKKRTGNKRGEIGMSGTLFRSQKRASFCYPERELRGAEGIESASCALGSDS